MKRKLTILIACLFCSLMSYGQNLKTIKNYYGLSNDLSKVYTVIAGTGTKHGTYKSYSRDGYLSETAVYKNNILNGPFKEYGAGYDPEDRTKVTRSGNYLNGKLHGAWTEYHIAKDKYQIYMSRQYKNGDIIKEICYYDYGKKSYERSATGINNHWWSNGKLWKQYTTKNNRIGNYVEYNGKYKQWYENGQLHFDIDFVNGKRNGQEIAYSEDGKIAYKATYANNKLNGEFIEYFENGQAKHVSEYVSGILVNSTEYAAGGNKRELLELADSENNIYSKKTFDTIKNTLLSEAVIVKSASGLSKDRYLIEVLYNPDSTKQRTREWNDDGYYRTEVYYPSGRIQKIYGYDNSIESYREDESMMWKIWRDKSTNIASLTGNYNEKGTCHRVDYYDTKGNITKTGYIDSKDFSKEIQYITYVNGVKHKELKANGDIYEYYENSKMKTHYNPKFKFTTAYTEREVLLWVFDHSSLGYIEYYPTRYAKKKGYLDKNNELTGVWYHYSENGKLASVEENGVKRKAKKDDRVAEAEFLIDLEEKNYKINKFETAKFKPFFSF